MNQYLLLKIITIDELVAPFSENTVVADQVILIIELYDVFSKITGSTESLDDFYYWGELMINDFNDIDKYLINAADLFRIIESLREIDAGFGYLSDEQFNILSSFGINLIRAKDTDSKQQFTHIWKNLYAIYVEFRKKLIEQGIAYEGMLYWNMLDLLKIEKVKIKGDKFAVFGFNTLNNCEKSLFGVLKSQYDAPLLAM